MRKILLEMLIAVAVIAVVVVVFFIHAQQTGTLWDAQFVWNLVLAICWPVVTIGYYHQGWLVRREKSTKNVTTILPVTVLIVQSLLFVKGIYYKDWSLIWGAIVVNSGVIYCLYQMIRVELRNF